MSLAVLPCTIFSDPFPWWKIPKAIEAKYSFLNAGAEDYIDGFGEWQRRATPKDNATDREFSEGLKGFRAAGKDAYHPGLAGFVDQSGRVAIKPAFALVGPFRGGLARATLDGFCFVLDDTGQTLGSPTTGVSSCGTPPLEVPTACKAGFINRTGEFVIPPKYDAVQDFEEDLAAFRIGGSWGYLNRKDEIAIPQSFDDARPFHDRLAAVGVEGKWSYIGRDGETKIKGPFVEATSFINGFAAVLLEEKRVAYIDRNGKTILEFTRE